MGDLCAYVDIGRIDIRGDLQRNMKADRRGLGDNNTHSMNDDDAEICEMKVPRSISGSKAVVASQPSGAEDGSAGSRGIGGPYIQVFGWLERRRPDRPRLRHNKSPLK